MPREFHPPTDEQRCTATTRKGTRCPKYRVKGTTVCLAHGAKAPQVRAAAARRVADQQAAELAKRIEVDIPQFATAGAAARYLVDRITLRAAQFGELASRLGGDVVYTDRSGVERLRAAIDGERKWLEALSRVLAVAVQAETAGRGEASAVELFSMTVSLFTEDVSSALCDAGLYEQHEEVMDRLRAHAGLRLRKSEGMIMEQIGIMSGAGRPREHAG